MNTKVITLIVMAAGALSWIVWDIIAASNRVPGDTISEISLAFARRSPIVPIVIGLIIGIILGHLWWPQR